MSKKTQSLSTANGSPILALRPIDAAKVLGISPRSLWALTADKGSGIPHFRIGRSVLYPVGELQDWVTRKTLANRA